MTRRVSDERFDAELEGFLGWQADDVAGAAGPGAMADRLARSLGLRSPARGVPQLSVVFAIVALALAVAIAMVGVALLGQQRSAVLPVSTPTATPAQTAVPSPSESVAPGVVAYEMTQPLQNCPRRLPTGCFETRIWVVNADGTGAHLLLPDAVGSQDLLAWLPDGARLLYRDGDGNLALTDATGSKPEVLPQFLVPKEPAATPLAWSLCPVDEGAVGHIYSCWSELTSVAVSPDGTRLAYAIGEDTHDPGKQEVQTSALAILDLPTRQVTKVQSTQTTNPGEPCTTAASEGGDASPSWSPDGTRLAFGRWAIGPAADAICKDALFTVNADGSDLRQLVPPSAGLHGFAPSWSSDGSSILFHGTTYVVRNGTVADMYDDIYTVRPDGSGLQALTSDRASAWPFWTRDGRIVFIRWTASADGRGDLWTMDADGANARQVGSTLPALTAAGCMVCPYATSGDQYFVGNQLDEALWQPAPRAQP